MTDIKELSAFEKKKLQVHYKSVKKLLIQGSIFNIELKSLPVDDIDWYESFHIEKLKNEPSIEVPELRILSIGNRELRENQLRFDIKSGFFIVNSGANLMKFRTAIEGMDFIIDRISKKLKIDRSRRSLLQVRGLYAKTFNTLDYNKNMELWKEKK